MEDTHPLPNLHSITNPSTHTHAYDLAIGTPPSNTDAHPTLIYVSSSSVPACQRAYPRVLEFARANPHIAVYVMELTAETAPMIKFGPQNCPILILIRGKWCETVLGADWRRVEALVGEFMGSGEGDGEKMDGK